METIEVVGAINDSGGSIEVLGMADDDESWHGESLLRMPVIGSIEEAVRKHPDAYLALTIGNPQSLGVRRRIVERLGVADNRYSTLIHPAAAVASSAVIGFGSIIQAQVVMTADVEVGRNVLVMPGVVLTHGDRVGDFVTIASGALISGDVSIGEGAYVGAGASIRERLTIGEGSLVGMGSTVLESVPPRATWAGTPARALERASLESTGSGSDGSEQG